MKLTKIETNIKRNLYLNITSNLNLMPCSKPIENQVINIYPHLQSQSIIGFGAAITQSSAYVLNNIDKNIADKIIDEYFSKDGLNYSICRLPIGSSDFSTKSYSYSYKEDLTDFSIENDKLIIQTIKMAKKRFSDLKFLASPWSPPAFMKNNNNLYHGGKLLEKYYSLWAKYLVRYVIEYKKENINIDYMTIQNEPNASQSWESCTYTSQEEANLLKNYLFPIFKKNGLNTKFLIWDHNKEGLLNRAISEFIDNSALDYAAGAAFHWYTGSNFENIRLFHNLFPNKLLIHSEGCTGYSNFKAKDELFNAELYASEIIGDFNAGANAFIDWNLVLDYKGGPNHKNNNCNSPIMINKGNNGYIKTPSFYYLSQFCKYIKQDAKKIASSTYTDDINVISFKNTNNSIIIVLLNKTDNNKEFNLCYKNYFFHDNLDSHAIVTFIINGDG